MTEPVPGGDAWRQWRHESEPERVHEAVPRATDGEGNRQHGERTDPFPFPGGAAGSVRRTVEA